jgi:heme-degrading monooxygenase HmoA
MYARLARYEFPEDQLESAVTSFREAGSDLSRLDGFSGGYVLLDEDGTSLTTMTLWATRSSLESSETRASLLRRRACESAGGSVQSVRSYEVETLGTSQPT